jgi:hypothetical protein
MQGWSNRFDAAIRHVALGAAAVWGVISAAMLAIHRVMDAYVMVGMVAVWVGAAAIVALMIAALDCYVLAARDRAALCQARGLCARCFYDLRGQTGAACPECGTRCR